MKKTIQNNETQKDQINDVKFCKSRKIKNTSEIDFDNIFQISSEKVTKIFKISNSVPRSLPYDNFLSST